MDQFYRRLLDCMSAPQRWRQAGLGFPNSDIHCSYCGCISYEIHDLFAATALPRRAPVPAALLAKLAQIERRIDLVVSRFISLQRCRGNGELSSVSVRERCATRAVWASERASQRLRLGYTVARCTRGHVCQRRKWIAMSLWPMCRIPDEFADVLEAAVSQNTAFPTSGIRSDVGSVFLLRVATVSV